MRNFKLRITRVDPYGYCGREHHPSKSDEGLLVSPVRMFHEGRSMSADSGFSEADRNDELDYYVWECRTDDGRTLELISHEVEMEFECEFCGGYDGKHLSFVQHSKETR